jgi:hypothetical protein
MTRLATFAGPEVLGHPSDLPARGFRRSERRAPTRPVGREAPVRERPRLIVAVRIGDTDAFTVDSRAPLEPTADTTWAGLGHPLHVVAGDGSALTASDSERLKPSR